MVLKSLYFNTRVPRRANCARHPLSSTAKVWLCRDQQQEHLVLPTDCTRLLMVQDPLTASLTVLPPNQSIPFTGNLTKQGLV